jgi:hypothetical protein
MPDDKIGFTYNEQNALALLCEMMAKASYNASSTGRLIDYEDMVDSVCSVADNFPSVNWGDLYDRFHRQGVNR